MNKSKIQITDAKVRGFMADSKKNGQILVGVVATRDYNCDRVREEI